MTYTCTNPACTWTGEPLWIGYAVCRQCASPAEDLDWQERAAIREEAPMSREDAERLAREDLEKGEKDLA